MNPLHTVLAEVIQKNGPMPFQRFMETALYHPQYGYYRNGSQKFGVEGDFITAPLLSPLFSRCVARQCEAILGQVGQTADILELGAGTGIMALHILEALEKKNQLPQCYWILELSADLQKRQQALIAERAPHFLERVQWIHALPSHPLRGIILANEVLDAMPVSRFYIDKNKMPWYQEYHVAYERDLNQFYWHLAPSTNSVLLKAIHELKIDLFTGFTSEINLLLPSWMKSLSDTLEQGVILLIDYGYTRAEYFHPQRHMGTLMCHYRHHAHDNPLIHPGEQDITAHVDFTAVAEAGVAAGLDVSGFTHQAAFLLNCGLLENTNPSHIPQIQQLTLPSEMGERFKVIALSKAFPEPLQGFTCFDQTERL